MKILNFALPCKTTYGKKLSILILFFVTVLISSIVFAAIPETERAALIALYNSTGGDNWTNKTGWKSGDNFAVSGTEGTWYGITVTNNHVTSIYLNDNNLSGSIPSELGNLSSLEQLFLYDNQLTGPIPSELGNITSLINLYLNHNQLTGISNELGNLSKLERLYLYNNQLTGSIPSELKNLTSLISLHLEQNQLTGSIPQELGNLIKLEDLSLEYNQLTGEIPAELGNLTKLKYLFLNNNQFYGLIPKELGNLANLQYLYLFSNHLSGHIPAKLADLASLITLYLEGNKLVGEIPSAFSDLNFLTNVTINYNALYTNDITLLAFLNKLQPNWSLSQTLAPKNVTTGGVTDTSVMVQWSVVDYNSVSGSYIVSYSTTPGGPYTYYGATASKWVTHLTVTGLETNTRYYFVVQTQTDSHVNNQNTVISDYSQESVYYPPLTDTDSDGIPDGVEDKNRNVVVDSGETDPAKADTDSDGISDGVEDANHNGSVDARETNPLNSDTDSDGMPDGWEDQYDLDPLINDADEDADGDGYSNFKEYKRKTIPNDYNSQPSKDMPWLQLLLGD